ncbi:hypothetical protein [Symbioplanes lichenis]|uniref:hypothetical protein n=1 Tax=Symbioplanes lichenis TaxID=1629072 RepID=UPI0027391119|nr:hypothetical protein [Actinoplanes lichenis]
MTVELEQTRRPVVHRTPEEIRADRRAAARRVEAALRIAVVTIAWLVLVPFLLGWGVLGAERSAAAILLAAMCAIVLPFTAAVLATRVGLFFTSGCYAVLTLVMVIPAISMVRAI